MAALTAANSKKAEFGIEIKGHSALVTGGARTDSAYNVIERLTIQGGGDQTTVVNHVRRTFVGFCPPTTTDYTQAAIGDRYLEFSADTSESTNPYDYTEWYYGANGWQNTSGLARKIRDPGDTGAIAVTSSGSCPIVSAGAETRTIAAPTFAGQVIAGYLKTDGGTVTITIATGINEQGSTTITLDDAGDMFALVAVENGSNLRWRVLAMQGAYPGDGTNLGLTIADPGDAGAIPVLHKEGTVALVSAGAETRTLAAPTYAGQTLTLCFKTDGGNCVVTCATTVNETGNNTLTFDNTGEMIKLESVYEGANLRWRATANDGVGLTTV